MSEEKVVIDNEINPKITVGIDIGTTKICCLVGAPSPQDGSLNILGVGIAESEGLNRGVVVNIDKTVKAIRSVVEQAQQQAGIKITEAVVGIAGDHIEAFQTRGIVGLSNQNHEINRNDVERLLEDTKKVAIPSERKIIHVIPQDYIIDGQDGIIDPVGMSGVRMEANVHVVTGLVTAIQNIYRCVERCGVKVNDVVLEPIASSTAILSEEEKEVGVALIDIGGGTTDVAIFEENIIRYTSVFGIAGRQVTDDVRKGLGVIVAQAERLKREFGHTYLPSIMKDEVIMIPGIGGRAPMEINKSYLCQIIQPRMEEIFEFAAAEIRKSGFENKLGAGIVLTGGTTLLRGTEDLAREIFQMPVKIGMPSQLNLSGLATEIQSPVFSTSVGLSQYGLQDNYGKGSTSDVRLKDLQPEKEEQKEEAESEEKKDKGSFLGKISNFLREL